LERRNSRENPLVVYRQWNLMTRFVSIIFSSTWIEIGLYQNFIAPDHKFPM
jgi:hypothetical protein